MSRRSSVPSYRKHRQSGQAVVTLPDGLGNRRDVLLGKYGTRESRQEYARVIAEWEAGGRALPQPGAAADLTVNEMLLGYWRFAAGYYRKNGEGTSQLTRIRYALKPVRELYGHTAAKEFGPLALKAVREWMIRAGWARGYLNSCFGCVKRCFKWAVENQLVPPSVYHGLQAVPGLRKGRSEAPESEPVRPVDDERVEATLPFLSQQVRTMVQVQRLTGMRPGEVIRMRPCDVDRGGKTWVYKPESHKTEHHGIARVVFIGPQARLLLKPFLDRDPGAYLFSPRESMAAFRARQRAARKTRVQPSQQDRRKRKPRRSAGDRYTADSYRQAVARACRKEMVQRTSDQGLSVRERYARLALWHPNQLRHSAATEIRREAGLDTARAVLGHRSSAMTERYAEQDMGKAAEVMARLG